VHGKSIPIHHSVPVLCYPNRETCGPQRMGLPNPIPLTNPDLFNSHPSSCQYRTLRRPRRRRSYYSSSGSPPCTSRLSSSYSRNCKFSFHAQAHILQVDRVNKLHAWHGQVGLAMFTKRLGWSVQQVKHICLLWKKTLRTQSAFTTFQCEWRAPFSSISI
jgi:hypothetical protein